MRNIPLGLDEPEDILLARVATRLKVPLEDIGRYAVVRRSLDARHRDDLRYVYSVELALDGGINAEDRCLRRLHGRNIDFIRPAAPETIEPGREPLRHRPVVVGFGPAGMFAALLLAEYGYKPIVLERGRDVRRRHRDIMQTFYREGVFNPESNLLYGEGGAGTYSDGKVYTRVGDPAVQTVLAIFCRFGADADVLLDAKPHIGSDRLPTICHRIRAHIEELGGEVRFDSRVDHFRLQEGRLVEMRANGSPVELDQVLLGIGHSARDTFVALRDCGVVIEARPFQLGVRIEHPQDLVNRWQYGAAACHPRVPPADYQLIAKGAAGAGGDLYSFCMCPGGQILPTNESAGLIATNGASRAARRGEFANSGFVITIPPVQIGNDPFAGISLQRQCEERAFESTGGTYAVPAQRCDDFLADRDSDGELLTSYPLGGKWRRIAALLPVDVIQALKSGLPMLDQKMPGFAGKEGVITAPESRASSPVRITRDAETRRSVSAENLWPIGEGAGYAGGIVSAAIDGMKSAEAIIRAHRPWA